MSTTAQRLADLEKWKASHLVNHVTTGHPATQAGVHGHPHPASAADGLTVAEVTALRALLVPVVPVPPAKPPAPTNLRATAASHSVTLAWA